MKSLLFASIVSVSLALSVQAGDRRGRNGNSQGVARARGSAPTMHVNSGFRYGGNRAFASSPRMTTRSMPTFSQRRILSNGNTPILHRQFTSRTFSGGNGSGLSRFESNRLQSNRLSELQGQRGNRFAQLGTGGGGNRTVGNISPGHNHVFAQRSGDWHRDWDRHHDHWWNGHRCRFVNGSWFIFDIGFFPWFGWPFYDYYAYDYYPYGYPYGYGYPSGYGYPYGYGYGYPYGYGYDPNSYDSSYNYGQRGYDSSYDDQSGYDSSRDGSYDHSASATIADVQALLAREGYYRGQIDGVLGPETRHALVRYQSNKGLEPSGSLTNETLQSLGLKHVAQD
jgi:hypothetical protein